jgi:hypothetical protein
MPRQPGLDQRHRDVDGEIHQKRGDTLVRTMRKIHGDNFLLGFRSDATLGTVLDRTGAESLSELVKSHRRT